MICPNCGGDHAEWVVRCPYCGSTNDAANEKEYMEHLEQLRNRLDVVDEESEELYDQNVGYSVKRTWLLVFALIAAAVLIVVVGFGVQRLQEKRQETESLSQQAWEAEHFPEYDALYEAGDYVTIINMEQELWDTDYSLYSWPHYYFVLVYYKDYAYTQVATLELEPDSEEELNYYDLGMALNGGLELKYVLTDAKIEQLQVSWKANGGCWGLTEEEAELVKTYREPVDTFFYETLGLSEAEVDALYERVQDDGFVNLGDCFDEAEQMIEERK